MQPVSGMEQSHKDTFNRIVKSSVRKHVSKLLEFLEQLEEGIPQPRPASLRLLLVSIGEGGERGGGALSDVGHPFKRDSDNKSIKWAKFL